MGAKARKPIDRLTVQDLTTRRVLQFLAHLEEDRGCAVQTRNQRLTAIRAFARFVASRDPGHLEWSATIRSIALKKAKAMALCDAAEAGPERPWKKNKGLMAFLDAL